jgi:hypothetical protein
LAKEKGSCQRYKGFFLGKLGASSHIMSDKKKLSSPHLDVNRGRHIKSLFSINKLDCLTSHLATFVNGHQFTYLTKLESKNPINDIFRSIFN